MKYPTRPAVIATMVPATNAFCMKWKCSSSRTSATTSQVAWGRPMASAMAMERHSFRLADDHDATVGGRQNLHGGPVQTRQGLGGDDLGRCADRGSASGDIDHPID